MLPVIPWNCYYFPYLTNEETGLEKVHNLLRVLSQQVVRQRPTSRSFLLKAVVCQNRSSAVLGKSLKGFTLLSYQNLPFEVEVFYYFVLNIKCIICNLCNSVDSRELICSFSLRFTTQLVLLLQKKLSLKDLPLPSICHLCGILCGWQLS